MYTRTVNGEELTFGTSGKLFRDALVMYDRQTGSLWTQVDGSVLRGELEGAQLQPIPAVQTTWAEWRRLHPDTLVLKQDDDVRGTPYADYFRDPNQMGIAGTQNPDDRLPGKALVITLREAGDSLAVPLEALERTGFYQTRIADIPVLITYSNSTPRVFDRRVHNRTLDFELHRRGGELILRDRQTQTRWSALTGAALEGSLAGQQLPPVPHMVNFWFAWVAYNPSTRLEQP